MYKPGVTDPTPRCMHCNARIETVKIRADNTITCDACYRAR